MDKRIEIILGDITKQRCDVIVNAANKSLLRGGGVDGAIHRAAGEELEKECIELKGCPVGEAKITKAYKLNNNGVGWIIHAVGPRWFDGFQGEDELLRRAYMNSLKLVSNYEDEYVKQCIEVLNKYILKISCDEQLRIKEEVTSSIKEYIIKHPIKTIAFPAISTGIYRFPVKRATEIALKTINEFLKINSDIEKVIIVCFEKETFNEYNSKLEN
jgi:O-acetyl-ADP-ribose deacetylase (regulator of RNase III)